MSRFLEFDINSELFDDPEIIGASLSESASWHKLRLPDSKQQRFDALVASALEPFDIDHETHSLEAAFSTAVNMIFENTGGHHTSLVERVRLLHSKAISHFGLPQGMREDELDVLAAFWVMPDAYKLVKLLNRPVMDITNDLLDDFTLNVPLINPAYSRFKPRDLLNVSPSRGLEAYPRPHGISLLEFIGGLIGERERIHLLEVGVGTGEAIGSLKNVFGDSIETYGCGMENYAIDALDHQYVGPIETAPFMSDSFDVIISNYASCYFTYPIWAYRQMARMAKTGGHMFLDVSPRYKITLPEITEIAGSLLGIDSASDLDRYIQDQYRLVFGQDEILVLKRLEEFFNSDRCLTGKGGRYQVKLVDGGDCRAYPVWVTKL